MAETKAEALFNGSIRAYERVQHHNNVTVPAIDALLATFGIDPAAISTAALTNAQRSDLLVALCAHLATFAHDAGAGRTFESDLQAAGYATVDDAIADITNLFAGSAKSIITTDHNKMKALLSTIDGRIIDDAFLASVLKDHRHPQQGGRGRSAHG